MIAVIATALALVSPAARAMGGTRAHVAMGGITQGKVHGEGGAHG